MIGQSHNFAQSELSQCSLPWLGKALHLTAELFQPIRAFKSALCGTQVHCGALCGRTCKHPKGRCLGLNWCLARTAHLNTMVYRTSRRIRELGLGRLTSSWLVFQCWCLFFCWQPHLGFTWSVVAVSYDTSRVELSPHHFKPEHLSITQVLRITKCR